MKEFLIATEYLELSLNLENETFNMIESQILHGEHHLQMNLSFFNLDIEKRLKIESSTSHMNYFRRQI